MAYITLANLKTYGDFQTTTDDTLLTDLISRAEDLIEAHCRMSFECATATNRAFDAVEDVQGMYLWFGKPIANIVSVTNGDSVVVSSSEYVTEPRNVAPYYGIKLLASSGKVWTYTTDPEDAITVNGYWAYSTTPPDDIKQACYRLTLWLYKQRETDVDLDRPLIAEGGITIMPTRLPQDVLSILNLPKYKKVVAR